MLQASYLGLCKLENEILKEAKKAENHIFRRKNHIFGRFLPPSKFHFLACTTLVISRSSFILEFAASNSVEHTYIQVLTLRHLFFIVLYCIVFVNPRLVAYAIRTYVHCESVCRRK